MDVDHDAGWQKLKDADPELRLSYDASALSVLVAQARSEALAPQDGSIIDLFDSAATGRASEPAGNEQGWWQRHWRKVLAGSAALTLAGGLTAGGIAFNARTGWFGTEGSENGTSEMIDQRGDDYVQLVKDAEPEGMVYPAGLTRADASAYILSQFPAGEFAFLAEDGIRADYCHFAKGMWELMWQRALAANDAAGQENALAQIDDGINCANNFHVWGEGLYDFLMARQTAARAGNPEPLLQDLTTNTSVEFRDLLDNALESAQ